jgi:hypothetical protein
MSKTRRTKTKRARGFILEDRSKNRLGPTYAFEALSANVLTGFPKRISIKALMGEVRRVNTGLLSATRSKGSKLFYVEGPAEQVRAVAKAADSWLKSAREGAK